MDDMGHVWRFLEGLRDTPEPNYRGLIGSRLKGFKHWNPDKIDEFRKSVDNVYREASGARVTTANFALQNHNRWLDILAETRKNLS